MLNTREEIRDFRKRQESYTKERRHREVREGYENIAAMWRAGEIDRNRFSLRRTFEECVTDRFGETVGHRIVEEFRDRGQGGSGVFVEAGDVISTAMISNIIGQVTFGEVMDEFEKPQYIAMDLVHTRPKLTGEQEMIPGVTMIGDAAGKVGEGESYPEVTVKENFVVMPRAIKDGFVLSVTEEAIFEDKTNLLLDRARKGTESIALTMEKEGLAMLTGVTTSWKWKNQTAVATYGDVSSTHPFDNLAASNALTFDNVDAALNLLYAMTDLNTGEKLGFPTQLDVLIPHQLRTLAHYIFNGANVENLPNGGANGTTRIMGSNPLTAQAAFNVKWNNLVTDITSSNSTWFIGDMKGAFEYAEIYPPQLFVEDRNSAKGFERDIVFRNKVRRRGAFGVRNPQRVVKCTG